MRQLPQTNFEEKLSLVYEKMTNSRGRRPGRARVLKESFKEELLDDILQTDGVMDIFEFEELARKFLGQGEQLDGMSRDDIVDLVGRELGFDLEVRGDRVMVANIRGFGEENAEGSSMRSYIEDEIINAFEGDGVMDTYEFDNLARKYLGGGGEYDDMSQDDIVDLVGDEIGLDLEVRDDKVYLVDYKDSGEENAGGSSMRSYIEDEIINAFEGDGVMDTYEFDNLARKYLGGGGEYDDMSQDDIVDLVGDEIGLDLEVRDDKVYLVDYKDSGEENAGDAGGGTGDFSIGSELFNLYSNLDREARTRSGSLVSEELKTIIDELDVIVRRAERFGSKFDLIKQLRLD